MSWAYGIDKNGREIGYGVEANCDLLSCKKEIDRGLSFRCGGTHSLHNEYGCGNYFCSEHMYFGKEDQLCRICLENELNKENME